MRMVNQSLRHLAMHGLHHHLLSEYRNLDWGTSLMVYNQRINDGQGGSGETRLMIRRERGGGRRDEKGANPNRLYDKGKAKRELVIEECRVDQRRGFGTQSKGNGER